MHCRHCGAPLQQGLIVCPQCGTRQRHRASSTRCAACGRRASIDLAICPHCGRALRPAGPRWAVWLAGLAIVVLAGLWGLGRLPVGQIRQDIEETRDRLAGLVRIPDMPGSPTLTAGSGVGAATGAPASSTLPPAVAPVLSPSATVVTSPTSLPSATSMLTPTSTLTPTLEPTATLTPTIEATPTPEPDPTYVVQNGDNLSIIGERTGYPWEEIARLNGMNQYSLLSVGQVLKLPRPPTPRPAPTSEATQAPEPAPAATTAAATGQPAPTATTAPSATPAPTATAQPTPVPTATAASAATTYRVKSGDTLASIAAKFGITWQSIAAANGITGRTVLSVGQELIIPAPGTSSVPEQVAVQPTAAAAAALPAPGLLLPDNGASFTGDASPIVLTWHPVDARPADAVYEVRILWDQTSVRQEFYWRTPSTSAGVPSWLWAKADQPSRSYFWYVRVVRLGTDGRGNEQIAALSPNSEQRTFEWH